MSEPILAKQGAEPAFPNIFWNRPLNRRAAKKLLIIGGHAKQFSQTQASYLAAKASGIGDATVVLPESTRKYIKAAPDCLFVAETKSGSLAKAAYPEIKGFVKESDGVLLAGEVSQNAETISVLEQLLNEVSQQMVISADLVELMLFNPSSLFAKSNRVLLGPTQLFVKLANALDIALQMPAGGLPSKIRLVEQIAEVTKLDLILLGHELLVHSQGRTSVTNIDAFSPDLFGIARGAISTFYLQHEQKFEALTTACFVLSRLSMLKNQGFAGSLKNLENVLSEYV